MPSCAATALAVVSLSPVAITIFKPKSVQLGDGLRGGRP